MGKIQDGPVVTQDINLSMILNQHATLEMVMGTQYGVMGEGRVGGDIPDGVATWKGVGDESMRYLQLISSAGSISWITFASEDPR